MVRAVDAQARRARSGGGSDAAAAPPPSCEVCEDERATKYCHDCTKNKFVCDACHDIVHKSAKKQGHKAISVQEHLASQPAVGGGSAAAASASSRLKDAHQPTMCSTHTSRPLEFYCSTCNVLVCSTCGILEHNGHDFVAISKVEAECRDSIEAAVAELVVVQEEAETAVKGLYSAVRTVDANAEAAEQKIDREFAALKKQLLQAVKERRGALVVEVKGAAERKKRVLEVQTGKLEDAGACAADAVQLANETLQLGTPTQLVQAKPLFATGLARLAQHKIQLAPKCNGLEIDVEFSKGGGGGGGSSSGAAGSAGMFASLVAMVGALGTVVAAEEVEEEEDAEEGVIGGVVGERLDGAAAALRAEKDAFGSMAAGHYTYSEGGTVATKVKDKTWGGAICDVQITGGGDGAAAAAAAPMVAGKHHAQFGIVKNETSNGAWSFGVCRPGIDLNDGKDFQDRDDAWMMVQSNNPSWVLCCNSNKGNFVRNSIKRELNAGDRVGLLLDLDNGGTLTLYLDGKPCGTIAEGLVGPLHWCIMSYWKGKAVRIHSLPVPPG